jgi:CubicO group peptidase (beta-lactamase class C family)
MARWAKIFPLLLITGLLAACVRPAPQPVQTPTALPVVSEWPTLNWPTSLPQDQGIDPNGLAHAAERAQKMNLHSLLVIRNGVLVSETYFAGNDANTRHELYSVTKSFTATLVGIANDQGSIPSIDAKLTDVFRGIQPQNNDTNKSSITLRNMLTMTSGLDWQEGDDIYRALYQSPDWVQYVMNIPMHDAPGSIFNYCSGCSHVLSAVVQQSVGVNTREFANANLFIPLGITNYRWDTDAQGIPIGGWGLQLTPRDMAKLGYLYLHNGLWDGKQIVSSNWIAAATRTQVETGGDWGYGYQWWIDTAHKAYAARGRYGQLIYVVPDLDLIVVSTAAAESDAMALGLIYEDILPAVKEP